jgi:hypothetical protein
MDTPQNVQAYIDTRRMLLLYGYRLTLATSIQMLVTTSVLTGILLITALLVSVNTSPYNAPALRWYVGVTGILDVFIIGLQTVARTLMAAGNNSFIQRDAWLLAECLAHAKHVAPTDAMLKGSLKWASDAIRTDGMQHPERIMLVPASFTMVAQYTIGLISMLSLSLRLITLA